MDNFENNSVLLENTLNDEGSTEKAPRRSLSQPALPTTQSSSATSSNVYPKGLQIPILKTYEECEELKAKLYTMTCKAQMHEYNYRELKATMPKSAQEIIDEYILLKGNQLEADEKIKQYHFINQELIAAREKFADSEEERRNLELNFEKIKENMNRKISELEALVAANQNRTFDQNQSSQTITNTTNELLTMDEILKKDDPNFTITSDEERRIQQLEYKLEDEKDKVFELEERVKALVSELEDKSARLAESDTQKAQLMAAAGMGVLGAAGADESKTFMIGNARDSVANDQLVYIDRLEKQLKETQDHLDNATSALSEYMNQVTRLERENAARKRNNTTFDSSSYLIDGKSSEQLREQIARVNVELNTLRSENRDLRIRCDQLNGGDGNVSNSFGQSRVFADALETNNDLSRAHATGRFTAMSSLNGEMTGRQSARASDYSDNESCINNSSAERKMNEEDNENYRAVLAEFDSFRMKSNVTIENSLNTSMPPPNKQHTDSFLKKKSAISSPVSVDRHGSQSLNNSFASKTSSAVTTIPVHESTRFLHSSITNADAPLIQEVQEILDCSAALLESGNQATADVEQMQSKMKAVRDVLARLFKRLKSSAALFEEILEDMGSSSPLAEKIKNMKLAFETSVCDHAEISGFLESAERDLMNMTANFSLFEKSIIDPSFVADVSRRFTIAPRPEDLLSSSLLNSSYTPMIQFGASEAVVQKQHQEIEELKMQIVKLHEELDKAKNVSLRLDCTSPGLNSSILQRQLNDVQIKASQNFEELEVAQGQLVRVQHEKEKVQKELQEISASYRDMKTHAKELDDALEAEKSERIAMESEYQQKIGNLTESLQNVIDSEAKLLSENDILMAQLQEMDEKVEKMMRNDAGVSSEETEQHIRDLRKQLENMRLRAKDAEMSAERNSQEVFSLNKALNELTMENEKLRQVESGLFAKLNTANVRSAQMPAESYTRSSQTHEQVEIGKENNDKITRLEKEAIEGIVSIQKELAILVDKQLKCKPIYGNISSIGVSCNEICQRLVKEKKRQHEQADALRKVNDFYESTLKQNASAANGQENIAPMTSNVNTLTAAPSQRSESTSVKNYRDPTRQLLHDSTKAVDAAVQKLKKMQVMEGMNPKLKETLESLLLEMRALRDFLHNKFVLFKSIDLEQCRNETNEQLWQRLARSLQDLLIVEEECKKLRGENKKLRGSNYVEKIQKELAGIASDQMRTVSVLKK